MNSVKSQKDKTLKDELPKLVGAQHATAEGGEIAPERMRRLIQSKNNTKLWISLVIEVKSDAIKNNIAYGLFSSLGVRNHN